MPTFPYLSLTLINQRAAACYLDFGGYSTYWVYNGKAPPDRIETDQTLSQITNQAVLGDPAVDATLVLMQGGDPVWQLNFWCPSVGVNNVTSMQRGYGAVFVRLAPPWNSRSSPLVVTGTIIQTGRAAATGGVVEPAGWMEPPELPLAQILYRRFRRGRRKTTSSIVRIGPAAPDPAEPGS